MKDATNEMETHPNEAMQIEETEIPNGVSGSGEDEELFEPVSERRKNVDIIVYGVPRVFLGMVMFGIAVVAGICMFILKTTIPHAMGIAALIALPFYLWGCRKTRLNRNWMNQRKDD